MKKLILALLLLLWCGTVLGAGTSGGLGYGSGDYGSSTTYLRGVPGGSLIFDIVQGASFYNSLCTQAATVSRNSVCQLYNPVGSGVNILPNTVKCYVSTSGFIQLSEFDTARTTPVTVSTLKLTSGLTAHGQVFADNIAAVSASWLTLVSTGTTPFTGILPISFAPVIKPGTGMEVEVQTQNIALNCAMYWSEAPQ